MLQVAYLACTQFLDNSSDLIILVVNTIQRDLKSDNHLIGRHPTGQGTAVSDKHWLESSCAVPTACNALGPARRHPAHHGNPIPDVTVTVCSNAQAKTLRPMLTAHLPLKRSAPVAVCCALSATCRLLSTELISAVLPTVTELLKHPKELVRKKAVMAIHRFEQLDPDHDGPLHNIDTYALIRDALRDKVLSCSITAPPSSGSGLASESAQSSIATSA